jgi:glutamyl-tRNA synthetase
MFLSSSKQVKYSFSKNFGKFYCVRVRMAPSPTGKLHLGGLRTALFNYLEARKKKGTFVLRIEDTDQTRYDPESEENIYKCLEWAGIIPNEMKDIGEYGPYKQSERTQIYQDHVKILLENKTAYKCFCTEELLTEMKKRNEMLGKPQNYDGRCRMLPINNSTKKGQKFGEYDTMPYTVRLKVPTGEIIINDNVIGDVVFSSTTVTDQILLKSDGFPTYHLANVVDDHLMKITHVIRGEEWLNSTPKHVLLYRAFGWDLPKFYHIPLLLNADRSKLSKRTKDISVADYMTQGYLPSAVVNFVALLGWSPPNNDEELFYTMKDIYKVFSLRHLNKSASIVDPVKLIHFNKLHMQHMLLNDPEKLIKLFVSYLQPIKEENLDRKFIIPKGDKGTQYLKLVLENVQDNFSTIRQTILKYLYFFADPIFNESFDSESFLGIKRHELTNYQHAAFFDKVIEMVRNVKYVYSASVIKGLSTDCFGSEHEFLGFKLLRYYLSGCRDGEELEKIMTVLPKHILVERLTFGKFDFENQKSKTHQE